MVEMLPRLRPFWRLISCTREDPEEAVARKLHLEQEAKMSTEALPVEILPWEVAPTLRVRSNFPGAVRLVTVVMKLPPLLSP